MRQGGGLLWLDMAPLSKKLHQLKKQIYTEVQKNPLFGSIFSYMRPLLVRVSLLVLLISISFMTVTEALFVDVEGINGNTFATGTLDFTLTSPHSNFIDEPGGMKPGTTVTREVTVTNTGTLTLLYRGQYLYTSGDTTLCDALTLKVEKGTTTLYSGFLSNFLDFTTPMTLTTGSTDTLTFSVTLPANTPPSLSGKTCSFTVPFVGWQTDTTEVKAGFKDSEILEGNILGTADFEPPLSPTIYQYKNDIAKNSSDLKYCWEIVSDPQNLHNPVTYEFERYSDSGYTTLVESQTLTESANKETCGTFGDAIVKHAEGQAEGHVYWRMRAVDTQGNASSWTSAHFIIDNTAPTTAISVSNSWARTITEEVNNSSFEFVNPDMTPTDWDTEGDVEVVESDHGVTPHDGSHMVKIGRDVDPGQDITMNSISQPIPNNAKNISFWYNFLTYDYFGYDEPGFVVFINDKMVYQMWARDIATGANPDKTGWKQFLYDISSIPQGEQSMLTIVFHAGNTDDPTYQSWVYVDQVSTADVVINNNVTFTLTPSDNLTTPTPWYKIGDSGTNTKGSSFQLSSRPNGDILSYWSIDEASNEETPHKTLRVLYDDDAPDPIRDLTAIDWTGGEFSLNFTAVDPNDTVAGNTTATSYDVRYSTAPITNDTEFDAATAIESTSPRPAGETERISIKGLMPDIQYWFAVKAKDAAPNVPDLISGSTTTNGPTVVLNEILPDPEGDDAAPMTDGEWVELYNNAEYDIDVANWMLYDSNDTHELYITPANTDSGTTIVPAHGWLVVYRNGDGDFELNNNGDTVRLFHQAIGSGGLLIDSYTYPGTQVTKGESFARVPDGTGSWIDPVATPGKKNVKEQGAIPIGTHEPDEIPVTEDRKQKTEPTPTPTLISQSSQFSQESQSSSASPSGQILGIETTIPPTPTPSSPSNGTIEQLNNNSPSPTPTQNSELTPSPSPESPQPTIYSEEPTPTMNNGQ